MTADAPVGGLTQDEAEAASLLAAKWEDASRAARSAEHHWPADCLAEAAHMMRAQPAREAAARAEAEARWMKVTVMRDGEAIREAKADAYDEGVAAGQEWGRRVNAAYPRNPYRADAPAPREAEPVLDGPSFGDYWPTEGDPHPCEPPGGFGGAPREAERDAGVKDAVPLTSEVRTEAERVIASVTETAQARLSNGRSSMPIYINDAAVLLALALAALNAPREGGR